MSSSNNLEIVNKQKKFMLKKFGNCKTRILLCLYKKKYVDIMTKIVEEIEKIEDSTIKIEMVLQMYKFIYIHPDIVYSILKMEIIIKQKLFSYSIYSHKFLPLLEKFGYICNHTTLKKQQKCHNKCDYFECRMHQKCSLRLKTSIFEALNLLLPKDVSKIVLRYVLPRYCFPLKP